MALKSRKMDRPKTQSRKAGFFCIIFLCTAVFVLFGCQSKHTDADSSQNENIQQTDIINSDSSDNQKISEPDQQSKSIITALEALNMMQNNSVKTEAPRPKPDTPTVPTEPVKQPQILFSGTMSPGLTNPAANNTDTAIEDTEKLPIVIDPKMADELISVNFDEVDIRVMLKTIGDITGINFIIDDSVKGNVTVMSPTKIRLAEVYQILESILEVKGYAAIPSGNLVKIVPRAKASRNNLQVRVGNEPEQIPQNDSIITQIIPLVYAEASEVSNIIRPLLSLDSHMAVYPRTNSILLTDTSANIHHIVKIIRKIDVTGSEEKITVIGLNYASAQVLSEQIAQIMQKNSNSAGTPAQRNRTSVETDMKILPDVRTNSLIVVANTPDTETIMSLAKQLDIQRPLEANNVHVIYLKNAPAKETAESLTIATANLNIAGALETGQQIQIAADEGTNALIITASAQDFEVISGIAEKLDIVREQVLVEMMIMEVSEDALKEIGIDWATLDDAVTSSVRAFAGTNFGPRVDFAAGDLEGLSIGAWRETGSGLSIGAILHMLEKESSVNILSTPHITTSNHQKAKIIVGENRPFVTDSRITETTNPATPTVIKSYEYKDVGISLDIIPHISQGGLVRLEIISEFTKLVESATTDTDTPTTAKRQAETVVSMQSGSTVVIGGLIRDDKSTIEKKVPLLGDIPILGGLFKTKKDQLEKTNLIIFITPHVMTTPQDMLEVTRAKTSEYDSASVLPENKK